MLLGIEIQIENFNYKKFMSYNEIIEIKQLCVNERRKNIV